MDDRNRTAARILLLFAVLFALLAVGAALNLTHLGSPTLRHDHG
jgi:hypothetical protein